jgi:phosphoribosyl 1,2-cyclic phosphodiesterase
VDVTLLGSGSAPGMPTVLCECDYCRSAPERLRPGLLVETDAATVVFDVGPDLRRQLRETDTTSVDAFFLTHFHRDHADGLLDLLESVRHGGTGAVDADGNQAFDLYATETAIDHLRATFDYTLDVLDVTPLGIDDNSGAGDADDPNESRVAVGNLRVRPFRVDHHRPTFDTVGFVAGQNGDPTVAGQDGGPTVGYAPDMARFVDGPPDADLDLFVAEGSGLLGHPAHGDPDDLADALAAADADRTVLVNAHEHCAERTTAELRDLAATAERELGEDYELGEDFASYEL